MEGLAFDNGIITAHPLYAQCGCTLDALSKKDYPDEDFFDKSIECLDMDAYETQVCHGNQDYTMDAVMGVKNFSGNRFGNPSLLLVELRMDYKSEKNLSKTGLEKKINHTKVLLGSSVPINEPCYFIFRPGVIQRVRRWFRDKSNEGGTLRQGRPLSTHEFSELIKPESAYPYTPITDTVLLGKELCRLLPEAAYIAFIRKIEYWLKQAMAYRLRYNHQECNSIMEVLIGVWNEFRISSSLLSDEERLEAEILEEDYGAIMQEYKK